MHAANSNALPVWWRPAFRGRYPATRGRRPLGQGLRQTWGWVGGALRGSRLGSVRFGFGFGLGSQSLALSEQQQKQILKNILFSTHRRNTHGRTHVQKSSKPPSRGATWRQASTTKAQNTHGLLYLCIEKMSFEKVWRRTSLCVAHSRIPTNGSDPSRAFHPSACAVLTHACTGQWKNTCNEA